MDMRFTLTKSRALEIQASQVEHYCRLYGNRVRDIVATNTNADALDGDGPFDVVEVNRHIPRGGFIEALIERHLGKKTQASDHFA